MRITVGLILVLAACGDDGNPADAPGPDTSSSQPVTLTITRAGAPQPGIAVYFQAADSTAIATTTTDANGVASAAMPSGGFVTAVDPFPPSTSHDLRTFGDVHPGDALTLVDRRDDVPLDVIANLPMDAADPASYSVYTTCGGSASQTTSPGPTSSTGIPVALRHCPSATTIDVLAIDYNLENDPIDYLVKTGVAASAGGTLDLTTETWTPLTPTTFSVAHAALTETRATYEAIPSTARGAFSTGFYNFGNLTAASATFSIPIPASGLQFVEAVGISGSSFGNQGFYRWGATATASAFPVVEVGAGALLDFASYPVLVPATATIAWTTSPGVTPDLAIADVSTMRDTLQWRWSIARAFTGPAVAYPTLPGDAAIYNVRATDTFSVDSFAVARPPGGYDAIRAHVFDFATAADLATGASGHFEVAYAVPSSTMKRQPPRSDMWWFAHPR